MGFAPGLLPGRVELGSKPASWKREPENVGQNTEAMLRTAANGGVDVAILLGCDPLTDFPDASLAERAFNNVDYLISVDSLLNFTSTGADVVFPAAATATEVDGTFTNLEGRISPLNRKVTPPGTARPDWMIAAELAAELGADLGFVDIEELQAEIAESSPLHSEIGSVKDAGTDGLLLSGSSVRAQAPASFDAEQVPDGEVLLVAKRKMYDQGTTLTFCPSLHGLAQGATASMNPGDMAQLGLQAGAEVTVSNASGSIQLPCAADGQVARGCVAIEFNQPNARVAELFDVSRIVTSVRVEMAS